MPKGNNKGVKRTKKADPRASFGKRKFNVVLNGTSQNCVRWLSVDADGKEMGRFDRYPDGGRPISYYHEKEFIPEGELELEHAPDYWEVEMTPRWNS
jgi:hypothetical protein